MSTRRAILQAVMYRTVRHGIVEPVRIRPILRVLLLALGVLLILVTIVLFMLWRKAVLAFPASGSINAICVGGEFPIDSYQCGPTAADIALPSTYAHAALAASTAGVGCLIATYVLGRRSQTR